jgi:hypothetical protein
MLNFPLLSSLPGPKILSLCVLAINFIFHYFYFLPASFSSLTVNRLATRFLEGHQLEELPETMTFDPGIF